MFKNLLLALLVVTTMPFVLKADWVSIDKNKASNTAPNVTLLSHDNNSSVIKVDIAGFNVKEFVTAGKSYHSIDLLTDIFSTEPGSPELPLIAKVLAIPDQASVSVEVIETGEVFTFENISVPPARLSWFEGKPEPAYEENIETYQSYNVYPHEFVKVDPPSIFRDFRIARVSINPVRYIPAEKTLEVVSSITIRVNYGQGEVINPKTKSKKAIAPSFGKLYQSFIFNYQDELEKEYGGKEEGHELMLCIMPDEFVESFQVYADWNRQSGTDIHVTKFSDINANANNPDIIKDHITDAYYNWDIPPTYVLIVGDDGIFPKKIVNYDYSFPNEDYFVEIEGDDYFPEMMIGRFTNQGDYRMQVMINKFMLYEKNPYIEETDWFKKAVCCSNNYYESQVQTKRFAAERLLVDGLFTSVDTMMSDGDGWGSNCTYDEYDVVNVINEGRSFLNYRGEGWSSGWSASCYGFSTSNVSSLSNSQKFTFVTSIGCGVAMFDTYGGNCFGEEWVQLGSLTAPRGGIAFIGPTSNTHTTYNNRIDKGIYTGMFQEGMDTPGQALLRGKLYVYNVFGSDSWVEYHYRVYCVLGDPSLHIWKDVPLEVEVDHETSINVGSNTLDFAVTFASSGLPVENAQVCLAGLDIFATGFTNAEGNFSIEILPALEQEITVTVRGGNVYPYQGTITVGQPQELVEPFGDPLTVDLDGNTDGLINPNENCNITYTLKNWGNLTANNVQATISTSSTEYVEIVSTEAISFGTLSPGGSVTGDPFQFYVNPNCPVGETINLHLHVTSSINAWDYDYSTDVKGCKLVYDKFVVNDQGNANSNYRMDPGETVSLVLSISNIGEDIAPNVTGILSSNDPYITIEDTTGYFGTLNINNLAINTDDYYVVSVSESCPTEYMAEFSLKLYTEEGNYPYQTIPNFSLPVALPIPTDYSGPDAYGYYAYSNDDSFYEQTPVYNWVEIDELGTEINVPGTSDYTQTVSLPFTFKYYGTNYNNVRISTDGWIAFGNGQQIAPENNTLPCNDNVNNMVAVFWDDLYFYDSIFIEGQILYYNDIANHRFIIEWDSIALNDLVTEPHREVFQAILLDPAYYPTNTGDGEIIYQYKAVQEIASNSIGIENNSQEIGLQYVFNDDYSQTATNLTSEFALKFTTEPPFLYIFTDVDENPELGNNRIARNASLEQNYPNPFGSNTWIKYTIVKQSNITLNVYNIRGELIRTLQNVQQEAGKYSVEWNGLNDAGNRANSGIYFYRLQTDDFVETMKMFMLD